MLQARENLMEAIQAFLKKYDQIPSKEKSMALLLAKERFLKIKQAVEEEQNKPESMQELLLQISKDLQTLDEDSEQAAKVSSQYWKPPIYYDDDDDDEERIVEADLEEDIRLIEKLLNDDSFPHSSEELNSEIPDAIIKSFSPSYIPVEDKLLNNDYISLPEYESFHVDFYNVPSSPRPPEKPPDDDVYFDIEPDTGVLTTKVVDDISNNSTRELYVHMPNVLPTLPTLYPVFDTLLPFSSENQDKVFNPGILISKEEKSPHLLSHRGFKVFQLIKDSESPMMIYGGDIPILNVPYLHFYPP
ncbi:hypothetical protein Tco_0271998 [Tanacetum coccineum]